MNRHANTKPRTARGAPSGARVRSRRRKGPDVTSTASHVPHALARSVAATESRIPSLEESFYEIFGRSVFGLLSTALRSGQPWALSIESELTRAHRLGDQAP